MRRLHATPDCLAEPLQVGDVLDGIELLHVFRLDVAEAERLQSGGRQFRVVAQVGEQLAGAHRTLGADEVAHFAVERIFGGYAIYGFAACAALILGAKALGLLLKRRDTYYDD